MAEVVAHYNNERLHSALGYITPADKLAGRQAEILAQRRHKLAQARHARRRHWQNQPEKLADEGGVVVILPEQTTVLESLT